MFMKIPCSKCSKIFDTYPYKAKRHKHLFCSTVCQYEFKKQVLLLPVEFVLKTFKQKPTELGIKKNVSALKNVQIKPLKSLKLFLNVKHAEQK